MTIEKFLRLQRIQTLYLSVIIALGILLCITPVLTLTSPPTASEHRVYELSADGIEEISPAINHGILEAPIELPGLWGLMLTSILISVLAFADLWLVHNRILQARFNILLAILCLGYYGILYMYIWFIRQNFGLDWMPTVWAALPLICFVLTIEAIRCILKDEMRVRASHRLRVKK